MVSGMGYEQLYNSYYMQVYSFVMTLAKNRDLAEELTQQAFYKAMGCSEAQIYHQKHGEAEPYDCQLEYQL